MSNTVTYCKKAGNVQELTLWRQAEIDPRACGLWERTFKLHPECVWPYLDTHPMFALSRF